MRTAKSLIIALICGVLGTSLAQAADSPAGEKSLAEVLNELLPGMGADDPSVHQGPQQEWQEICFQLGTPGRESQRADACRLMAEKLGPDTPAPARIWLLKQLERLGRGECVDAVAAVLDDQDPLVRDAARRALANNPAPEAGAKLRDKLQATTDGKLKVGLINALGFRAEPMSTSVLAAGLSDRDTTVAAAAARALGKLATVEAAKALAAARKSAGGDLRLCISDAYLRCADKLLSEGKRTEAAAIYKELDAPEEPARLAALQGRLNAAGDQAPSLILDVLARDDARCQQVAVGHVRNLGTGAVQALAAGLPKLPPSGQVALLGALKARRDRSALPAVLAALDHEDESVKIAAMEALGGVGNASSVPLLVEAMLAGREPGDAARRSLESVFADGVDEKLVETMQQAEDLGQRGLLIEILDGRRAVAALPALLQEALHEDAGVRRRAMGALARLAGPDDVAGMIKAMGQAQDSREREDAEKAITSVCNRIPDEQQRADPVLAVYARASEAEKTSLLSLLGRIGGANALEPIRAALAAGDAERYEAGVRALCNWPDAAVAEDLLKLAENAREEAERIQAIRALARVAVLPGDQADKEKLELLKRAMERASRNEERDLILDRARAIRRVETLRFVAPYLEDPELSKRACRTIVDLANHRGLREPNRAEFARALEKVIEVAKDRNLAERARQYMAEP